MDRILGVPYIPMAVGLALLTGSIVLGVEKLVPWTTDSVPVSVYSCIKITHDYYSSGYDVSLEGMRAKFRNCY